MGKKKLNKKNTAALITAAATVLAAIIGLIAVLIKSSGSITNTGDGIQVVNPFVGGDQVIVGGDYYAPQPTEPQLHPDKPNLSYSQGEAYEEQQNYRQALAYYKQAAEEYEKIDGPTSTDRAVALIAAGIMHETLAEYPEAIDCYLEAEAIYKSTGENQADSGRIYNSIAIVYRDQGDYDKALVWFHRALEISEEVHGEEHQNVAAIYSNIAIMYGEQGNYDEALKWNFKALSIAEKELGTDDPKTAITYNTLGNVYYAKKDYEQSLVWHFKALAAFEKALGKGHPLTASICNNIACTFHSLGDLEEALDWHTRTLAINEKEFGVEHPAAAMSYNNMANLYSDQGDYGKALKFYAKAYQIAVKVLGLEHPTTRMYRGNMESTYQETKRTQPFDEWLSMQLKIEMP